jgi:PAS domain S-box-containing protein/putative nucleotidyltransferase with HDIG domain
MPKQPRLKWEEIFQAISHPTVILDPDHNFLAMNQAAVVAIGRSAAELQGIKCYEIFHGLDHPPENCPLVKLRDSLPYVTVETEQEALGGTFMVSCTPVVDEAGGLQQIIHITTDIGQRQRAEAALQRSEENYRSIFEHAVEGVFQSSPEGRFLKVNPALARMLGYDSPQAMLDSITDLSRQIYVDPRRRLEFQRRMAEHGQVKGFEYQVYRQDGSSMWISENARQLCDAQGQVVAYEGFIEDIDMRKQAQEDLIKAEREKDLVLRSISEQVVFLDPNLRVIWANRAATEFIGVPLERALGSTCFSLWHQTDQPCEECPALRAMATHQTQEREMVAPDHRVWLARAFPVHDAQGQAVGVVDIATEITARKLAERALKAEAGFRAAVIDHAAEGLCVFHPIAAFPHVRFTVWNQRMVELTGYSLDEINRRGWFQTVYLDPEVQARASARLARMQQGDDLRSEEWEITRADGAKRLVSISSSLLPSTTPGPCVLALMLDITERRGAAALFEKLTMEAPIGVFIVQQSRFKLVNPQFERLTGYAADHLVGRQASDLLPEPSRESIRRHTIAMLKGEETLPYEFKVITREGKCRWILGKVTSINYQGGRAALGYCMDVTQLKRHEEILQREMEKYQTLSEESPFGIAIISKTGAYQYLNPKFIEMFGYTLADIPTGREWFKRAYPDAAYRQEVLAHWGRDLQASKPGAARPRTFTVTCAGGAARIINFRPVTLSTGDQLVIYEDITESTRAEAALADAYVQLKDTLEKTVRALASAVETRDPYTAGHQLKVARLAEAIARRMGLPESQVEGVRLSGLIHDVGKLNVPGEILSRPGKLSESEMSIIKIHPQRGHEILKDIMFPWPLALTVLQHHERLDGSGYPFGLEGDDIILEARVLAVADVVEAISSHRPYRPALGVDAALEEISLHRSTKFDPQVVEACLDIFHQEIFAF